MDDRYLLDVNVCLDVLLKRDPHWHDAAQIFEAIERTTIAGAVSAISFDTMFYVMRAFISADQATSLLNKLVKNIEIVDVTGSIIENSLMDKWNDLEDCIQYHAAIEGECKGIITRDLGDFPEDAIIPIYTPTQFMEEFL